MQFIFHKHAISKPDLKKKFTAFILAIDVNALHMHILAGIC